MLSPRPGAHELWAVGFQKSPPVSSRPGGGARRANYNPQRAAGRPARGRRARVGVRAETGGAGRSALRGTGRLCGSLARGQGAGGGVVAGRRSRFGWREAGGEERRGAGRRAEPAEWPGPAEAQPAKRYENLLRAPRSGRCAPRSHLLQPAGCI